MNHVPNVVITIYVRTERLADNIRLKKSNIGSTLNCWDVRVPLLSADFLFSVFS